MRSIDAAPVYTNNNNNEKCYFVRLFVFWFLVLGVSTHSLFITVYLLPSRNVKWLFQTEPSHRHVMLMMISSSPPRSCLSIFFWNFFFSSDNIGCDMNTIEGLTIEHCKYSSCYVGAPKWNTKYLVSKAEQRKRFRNLGTFSRDSVRRAMLKRKRAGTRCQCDCSC